MQIDTSGTQTVSIRRECADAAAVPGPAPSHSGRQTCAPGSKMDEEIRASVLAAFMTAQKAGCSSVECYLAAVRAWREKCPDMAEQNSALQAVTIVLMAYYKRMMKL